MINFTGANAHLTLINPSSCTKNDVKTMPKATNRQALSFTGHIKPISYGTFKRATPPDITEAICITADFAGTFLRTSQNNDPLIKKSTDSLKAYFTKKDPAGKAFYNRHPKIMVFSFTTQLDNLMAQKQSHENRLAILTLIKNFQDELLPKCTPPPIRLK